MLKTTDVKFTEEGIGFGELRITGRITFHASDRVHKNRSGQLNDDVKKWIIDQLNRQIFGENNDKLADWVTKRIDELAILPQSDYQLLRKFQWELLDKIYGRT